MNLARRIAQAEMETAWRAFEAIVLGAIPAPWRSRAREAARRTRSGLPSPAALLAAVQACPEEYQRAVLAVVEELQRGPPPPPASPAENLARIGDWLRRAAEPVGALP
ncbi:MAG: hypothetical protein HY320_03580 [Armatimonadetes bacterium]|nr:hypothetical protein [Armatimonadota bacterium]